MPGLLPLLLAASPLFHGALAPLAPEADARAEQCGVCHPEALDAWAGSMHARSATDEVYRAGHDVEPMRWCDNCHQPTGEGVGCAACHVRDGVVLSAAAPTAEGLRAHPMRQEPYLATSELCGECHQFNFPRSRAEPVVYSPHPMQNTLGEWRATKDARACAACHPAHAPQGAHDLKALREALTVRGETDGREVRVHLQPNGVAHRYPTGDPFHRLRLEACADADCLLVAASRELGRRVTPAGDSWLLGDDLTVPPEGTTVEFPAAHARFLRVTYLYAARSSEARLNREDREAVLFTVVLAPSEVR